MSSEERVAFLTEQQAALCQRYAALNEQLKALQQQFMAANPDQAEALLASPDVLKGTVMRAHPHLAQGIASFEQLVTLTQSALEAGKPEQIRMVNVLQQFNATIRQSNESKEAMETQETGGRRVRTATKKAEEQEQVSANGRYKLSRNKTAVWYSS
jgi:AICAR transformylase/IMP cyclohydrolase PurH